MHKLTGSCHMCGMCCKAICIQVSRKELEDYHEVKQYELGNLPREEVENSGILFVWLNWEQITKEEAFAINPHLKVWEERYRRKESIEAMSFYTCTKFDTEHNKCSIYDKRPETCSGYPWYGQYPNLREPFYNSECGYKVDVIQEQKLLVLEQEKESTTDDNHSEFIDQVVEGKS